MGNRIFIVSDDQTIRATIQEEVKNFPEDSELSFIKTHIKKKYGFNVKLLYPRSVNGPRYLLCTNGD